MNKKNNLSLEGYCVNAATFAADGKLKEGTPVVMDGNFKVRKGKDGEEFIGFVLCCQEGLATVQTTGYIRAPKAESLNIQPGRVFLVCDGTGGVKNAQTGVPALVTDCFTLGSELGIIF